MFLNFEHYSPAKRGQAKRAQTQIRKSSLIRIFLLFGFMKIAKFLFKNRMKKLAEILEHLPYQRAMCIKGLNPFWHQKLKVTSNRFLLIGLLEE